MISLGGEHIPLSQRTMIAFSWMPKQRMSSVSGMSMRRRQVRSRLGSRSERRRLGGSDFFIAVVKLPTRQLLHPPRRVLGYPVPPRRLYRAVVRLAENLLVLLLPHNHRLIARAHPLFGWVQHDFPPSREMRWLLR